MRYEQGGGLQNVPLSFMCISYLYSNIHFGLNIPVLWFARASKEQYMYFYDEGVKIPVVGIFQLGLRPNF